MCNISDEITFGWKTGETITAGVYAPDGTLRHAALALTEIPGTGLYVGTSATVQAKDLVIFNDGTNNIGYGVYQPEVDSSTIITAVSSIITVYDDR